MPAATHTVNVFCLPTAYKFSFRESFMLAAIPGFNWSTAGPLTTAGDGCHMGAA